MVRKKIGLSLLALVNIVNLYAMEGNKLLSEDDVENIAKKIAQQVVEKNAKGSSYLNAFDTGKKIFIVTGGVVGAFGLYWIYAKYVRAPLDNVDKELTQKHEEVAQLIKTGHGNLQSKLEKVLKDHTLLTEGLQDFQTTADNHNVLESEKLEEIKELFEKGNALLLQKFAENQEKTFDQLKQSKEKTERVFDKIQKIFNQLEQEHNHASKLVKENQQHLEDFSNSFDKDIKILNEQVKALGDKIMGNRGAGSQPLLAGDNHQLD